MKTRILGFWKGHISTANLKALADVAPLHGDAEKAASELQSLVPAAKDSCEVLRSLFSHIERDITDHTNPSDRQARCKHYFGQLKSTKAALEAKADFQGLELLDGFLNKLEEMDFVTSGEGWQLVDTKMFEVVANYFQITGRHAELVGLTNSESLEVGAGCWSLHNQRRQLDASQKNIPAILFITLPKSASVYIWQQISKALEIPEVRIAHPNFFHELVVQKWATQLALGGAIAHQHMWPTAENVKDLVDCGIDKAIVHFRDPRQSLLSMVHWLDRKAPWSDLPKRPPREYLRWDVEHKVDWSLKFIFPYYVDWIVAWHEHRNESKILEIHLTNFEKFKNCPREYFAEISAFYGLPSSALDQAAGETLAAKHQTEETHFRKGMTDEWEEVFNETQKAYCISKMPSWLVDQLAKAA